MKRYTRYLFSEHLNFLLSVSILKKHLLFGIPLRKGVPIYKSKLSTNNICFYLRKYLQLI